MGKQNGSPVRIGGRAGGEGRFMVDGVKLVVAPDGAIKCSCRGWDCSRPLRSVGANTSSACAHADLVDEAIIAEIEGELAARRSARRVA